MKHAVQHTLTTGLLVACITASAATSMPTTNLSPVQSAVVVSVKNGDTLTLSLSKRETNRLLVAHDNIAGVVCPPTSCHAAVSSIDPSHSTYITLLPTATAPFSLHISTVAHRYFSLHVVPHQQAGVTVLIEPQSPGVPSNVTHASATWTDQLSNLVKAMMQNRLPDDYGVVHYPNSQAYRIQSGVKATAQLTWRGERMRITRYVLTNTTHHPIKLTEPIFYQPGVLAIALSNQLLSPHGAVTLYDVTTRLGGHA